MQIGTGQVLDGSSRGLNTASMPADRTQANQGVGNRFRRLYETLLPENLGKQCREKPAGKTEPEIKLLIRENSKPQDLIVYTDGSVTRDQSGWGFTVKQGETTTHENSGACTFSTSSFPTEVEAVTRAVRWIASRGDSRTADAIIFTDSMSLLQKVTCEMGSPDLHVPMFDIHLWKLL